MLLFCGHVVYHSVTTSGKIYTVLLIVPTPTLVGREELYTQMGFFVQSILADRYNHRRVVSGIIRKPVKRRIRN